MRINKRREQTVKETIETYKDVIELLGNKPIGDYVLLQMELEKSISRVSHF